MEAVEAAEAADAADDSEHGPIGRRMAAEATHRVRITNVAIDHPGALVGRQWLLPDEAMSIRVAYHADEPTDDLMFGIIIHDEEGNTIFGANTKIVEVPVPVADGDGEVTFDFEHVPLLDGTYLLTFAIQSSDEGTVHDWRIDTSMNRADSSSRSPARLSSRLQKTRTRLKRFMANRAGQLAGTSFPSSVVPNSTPPGFITALRWSRATALSRSAPGRQ